MPRRASGRVTWLTIGTQEGQGRCVLVAARRAGGTYLRVDQRHGTSTGARQMVEAMMAAELAEALKEESDAVRAEAAVFVDEAVCTRYLRARNHDCKAAVDMLLATTRWRVTAVA